MTRRQRSLAVLAAITLAVSLACVPLLGKAGDDETPGAGGQSADCWPAHLPPYPGKPQLDCPAPPNTFNVSPFFSSDSSVDEKAAAGPTFDTWAWSTFAAMNWPAQQESGDPATYPTGYARGVPDLTASFAGAADDDVLVWETFKEKRELFQPVDTPAPAKVNATSRWQAVTFDPGQEPMSAGNPDGIEPCAEKHAQRAAELFLERGHHRIFFQGRKHPTHPTAGGTETLDEVVEVASQAREPAKVLCAGYGPKTTPTLAECLELFPEDPANPVKNEKLLGERVPVGPRVWNGNPKDAATSRPVLFEVKLNYDYWRYILDYDLQLDTNSTPAALATSVDEHPKLPFRSSSAKGAGRSPQAVFGYDADATVAGYATLADPDALPPIGSVQVKAAWLQLTDAEIASGDFHLTEAIFFKSPEPKQDPAKLCYEVDTFGLLGLHIIQRAHSASFDRRNPGLFAPGGTFVFATWEHTSLPPQGQPSGYYYANYFAFPGPLAPLGNFPFTTDVTPFPNFVKAPNGAIPVVREMPYPLASTTKVNGAVHAQLPADSVWQNYRLIGTQFLAVDSEKESLAFNQPYYLANLVVETNDGLQKFQGLPPGVGAVTPGMGMRGDLTPYYTQKVDLRPTLFSFEREYRNVVFNRELRNPVNMGGCMGCHGVAQLKGFNFSFVFSDGQAGSGIDTQYHFVVAGGDLDPDDDSQTGTEEN